VLYSAGNITNVRTSFNNGKQRIVVDIEGDEEPTYYVRKGKNVVDITMEKVISMDKARAFAELLGNTNFIQKASIIVLPEEKETIISLNVNSSTSDDVFALAKPSRLVVDLEKTKPIKEEKE
jgi:hypothetical protein